MSPPWRNLAELLASMSDVGLDADFERQIEANGTTVALLKHLDGDGAGGIGCQIVRLYRHHSKVCTGKSTATPSGGAKKR